MLVRCYAGADILILNVGQNAFADQVVLIGVRAVSDDPAGVARCYSWKCCEVAFTGGIQIYGRMAPAVPTFLYAFGGGPGVFRRGFGHLSNFPARFLQRGLSILRGLGDFLPRLFVARFLRRGVAPAKLK